jgi:hypothetical protein
MRVYRITVRNKPIAIAIGAIALVAVSAFVAVGLALRAGVVAIRRLTGRPTGRPLDPAQEVFPSPPNDARRHIGPPD